MNPFNQLVHPFMDAKPKDPNERPHRQIDEETKAMIISVFANPQGLQLLDRWDDIYLRQPTCPPGCVEGYGYKREGENAFIIKLRRIVNEAQNPQVS